MLQVVSCKGQRRPQVLLRQLRVGFKQIRKRAAGTELAQYQLDRNVGAFDAWLTPHDYRMGADAGVAGELNIVGKADSNLSGPVPITLLRRVPPLRVRQRLRRLVGDDLRSGGRGRFRAPKAKGFSPLRGQIHCCHVHRKQMPALLQLRVKTFSGDLIRTC